VAYMCYNSGCQGKEGWPEMVGKCATVRVTCMGGGKNIMSNLQIPNRVETRNKMERGKQREVRKGFIQVREVSPPWLRSRGVL
jgi:hypothetical protein